MPGVFPAQLSLQLQLSFSMSLSQHTPCLASLMRRWMSLSHVPQQGREGHGTAWLPWGCTGAAELPGARGSLVGLGAPELPQPARCEDGEEEEEEEEGLGLGP